MNWKHSGCDDEQLMVLLRADENSEATRLAVSHVEQCDGCQKRLEELAASVDDWDEASELLAANSRDIADDRDLHANRWSAPDLAARLDGRVCPTTRD